jgi:HD-GYP domain-containing protein (c-di-GMP phosphodiesterase class II)
LTIRRIAAAEIAVGQALPWDVHTETGGLLLRQGHVIANENQLEMLFERGFIPDENAADGPRGYRDPPSVLRLLNLARTQLQQVLQDLLAGCVQGEGQAAARLAEVARLVIEAVDLDQEVALGCILLNQKSGLYAIRHSIDTATVALVLGRALKKTPEEWQTLVLASLTMNLGLLQHHERLQNTAAQLDEAELALVHAHPQASLALLKQAGIRDEAWLLCVLQHHENDDGSGYPLGKSAAGIGEAARIVALADRYIARVCDHAYHKPLLPNAALREILLESRQSPLATVLIRELGIYPIGTLVRLHNGEVGVVTRKGLSTTTPYVHALLGPRGAPLEVPLRRSAKGDLHGIREVLDEQQAGLSFRLEQLWGAVARP